MVSTKISSRVERGVKVLLQSLSHEMIMNYANEKEDNNDWDRVDS